MLEDAFIEVATLPGIAWAVDDVDGDRVDEVLSLERFDPDLHESLYAAVLSIHRRAGNGWVPGRAIRHVVPYAFQDLDGDGKPEMISHEHYPVAFECGGQGISYAVTIRADSMDPQHAFAARLHLIPPTDPESGRRLLNLVFHGGAADIDGDGRPELLASNPFQVYELRDGALVEIYRDFDDYNGRINDGSKRFAHGDFDGDGLLEVVVSARGPERMLPDRRLQLAHHVRVLEADGIGGLELRQRRILSVSTVTAAETGDYNGDGRPDFLVGGDGAFCRALYLYTAPANDTYEMVWSLSVLDQDTRDNGLLPIAAFGDTDGDGDDELAIVIGRTVSVFEWTGDRFARIFAHTYCEQCRSLSVYFGDFNGDGRHSLVVSAYDVQAWNVDRHTPVPDGVHIYERIPLP